MNLLVPDPQFKEKIPIVTRFRGPFRPTLPDRANRWSPPPDWLRMRVIDAHTAGEPLRVVVSGFPELRGETVPERRRDARARFDGLRRALMWEPRGHADMYGCLVGPPLSPGSDFSVLFTHNEGFSTMCGHGIIGVVTVVLECGLLGEIEAGTPREGEHAVVIDTPAGTVRARGAVRHGRVEEVAFVNVPSYAARLGAEAEVDGVGTVCYDLAYGGAFYALVDATHLGLTLLPSETERLARLGRRIKEAIQASSPPTHPDAEDLGFLYGTIFVGPAHDRANHSRNVCVFADGEVDRCPTGTGVSARLAVHHARGGLDDGETVTIESILGTTFDGRVVGKVEVGGRPAVVPEITGRAWITGHGELLLAPDDPLREGFLLR